MASQPSEQTAHVFELVAELQECARRGDWTSARGLAAILRQEAPPVNAQDTGEYLGRLEEALVIAKASRAHLAATLVRLNAAAGFHRVRSGPLLSQNFGETPET